MGPERDARVVGMAGKAAYQLHPGPHAENDPGRHRDDSEEDDDPEEDVHVGARVKHQVGAKHAGDRAAGADHRYLGGRIQRRLGEYRGDTAAEIQDEVAEGAEHVFDVVAENPQEQHVAGEVEHAAMQEHAGEDRRPRRQDRKFGRQLRIAEQHRRDHPEGIGDGVLVLPELPQIGADAEADQQPGDDRRPLHRIVVVERDGEDHAVGFRISGKSLTRERREKPIDRMNK